MDNLNYVIWGYYKYITNYFKLYLETFVLIVVWICTERPSTTESPATTTWPSSTTSSPVVPSKQFNLSLTFNVILTLLLLALLAFFLFRKFYSRSTPSTSHQSDVESAESQQNERDPLIVGPNTFFDPVSLTDSPSNERAETNRFRAGFEQIRMRLFRTN